MVSTPSFWPKSKASDISRLTRSKTDAVDLRLIANFYAEPNHTPWQASNKSEVTLRVLALQLDALQTMRTLESHLLGGRPVKGCAAIYKIILIG